ncbi:MAG: CotH kinase family protein [Saprospiraceae bacterium]
MKRLSLLLLIFLTAGLQMGISQEAPTATNFYDTDKVQDIKITFSVDDWQYYLDSLRFNGNGLLEATVEINGQKFEHAGVRFRGTRSFAPGMPRNPLHIELDYKNKDQNIQGYKTLKLSNSLRDPSLLREVLGYEIARSYMPAPKANFARVTVNDKYYGLLVNLESVEEPAFLEHYFGTAGNSFFKARQVIDEKCPEGCKQNIYGSLEYDSSPECYEVNFEKLSDHGTPDLMELALLLNEDPGRIESVLNVDVALWMLAFNNVLVNLSSYSGHHSANYYLYKDKDGRFNPIIWDLNLCFGSYKNIGTGSDLRTKGLIELDPLLHADNPSKPLASKLLENEEYRKMYLSHMRTILHDYFLSGKFEERAKALQSLIRPDVEKDVNRSYSMSDFDASLNKTIGRRSKIPGLVQLMSRRSSFLKSHPALAVFPSEISTVEVTKRTPLSNKKVENFHITATVTKFPKRVLLMYRLTGQEDFNQAPMKDDGKSKDGEAGDGVYGITIVPQNGETTIEYYIVAENAGLFSYSPANYMWEQHSTSLTDLNK